MYFLTKLTFPAFLLFIFCLPIPLGSNRSWVWSFNEFYISLLVLTCLFTVSSSQWRESLVRGKYILIPLLAFVLWSFIQSLPATGISLDNSLVFVSALKSLHYLQVLIVGFLLVTSERRLKVLMLTMISSGVFQAFYAAVLNLIEAKTSPVFGLPLIDRASGSFVYHNHLANFLMLNLCLGFALLVSQLRSRTALSFKQQILQFLSSMLTDKAIVRLGLIMMVIALVLTRSRMGNTAFFSALIAASLLFLIFYKNKPKSLYILIISIFVIDTFIVSYWFGLEKVQQRLLETSLAYETRDEVLTYSLEAIKEKPITGHGAGTFYSTFPGFKDGQIASFYDHAHNDYIQFLLESGLIGCMILIVIVLCSITFAIQAAKHSPSIARISYTIGCLSAIIGMMIHMTVDFPLQAPANAIYFLLILSIPSLTFFLPQEVKLRKSR